jgi:hypothetical protein
VRIEVLEGQRIETDSVHREVAPSRRFGEAHPGVVRDVESRMAGTDLAIAPGKREVDVEALYPKDAEGLPDMDHFSESREESFEVLEGEPEDLDVEILGFDAEEPIANVPADDEGASAFPRDRLRHAPGYFETHG